MKSDLYEFVHFLLHAKNRTLQLKLMENPLT